MEKIARSNRIATNLSKRGREHGKNERSFCCSKTKTHSGGVRFKVRADKPDLRTYRAANCFAFDTNSVGYSGTLLPRHF